MKQARELWLLIRDILFVLAGIYLLAFVTPEVAKTSPEVALAIVPVAGGLFALPSYLRRDERERD